MEFIKIIDIKKDKFAKALYREAFPLRERKPYFLLKRESVSVNAISENGVKCGIIIYIETADLVYIDFFAISAVSRGGGKGGSAIDEFCRAHADKRIVLEIENPYVDSDNAEQREKRRNFYLRHGFTETDVNVKMKGLDAILMTYGGKVSYDQYLRALTEGYGKAFVKFLSPVQLNSKY